MTTIKYTQNMKKACLSLGILLSLAAANGQTSNARKAVSKVKKAAVKQQFNAYLFTYFTGNDKVGEQLRFAISTDGYNFRALNGNNPILNSADISSTGGIRDPHILRGEDGNFYMVATDMAAAKGWDSNRAMILMKSPDLINWKTSVVNFQTKYAGNEDLKRVWAPQTIWDSKAGKYMVYFSLKNGSQPDKIYYAYANADFTDLETEPKQLYFSPNNAACIDADIILKDGKYHLFYKGETGSPGIKLALSDKLTEGYQLVEEQVQQTKDPVEGSGVFKLNNGEGYILMYDMYTKGKYQFTQSKDLRSFTVVDKDVTMDFHPRHGTVIPITGAEVERLISKWLPASEVILSVKADGLKQINVALDEASKTLYLPVRPGTNLKGLKPQFGSFPGVEVEAPTVVNFAAGPVKYKVTIKGQAPVTYTLLAKEYHNAALEGYYADPDVLYSEKTGKFYIYPTSDGFTDWSGTYFKAFSSSDLVNWKDEGVILDLKKDVSWAKSNAWAPCIIEKKVNGQFKYFYYFTANKKIGVAVADNPTGPFVDSGKPVVDKRPDGVIGGMQIDPDVFSDPQTGKSYLYWGNGYMAGAELSDDMLSIKTETYKVLTPEKTFREGTYVFFRNGKYYFSWSENDTRSEDYRVRYGIADSPLGTISIPQGDNLILSKDKETGIYGPGHHSVLQIPGRDEWYMVYHRFNYPKGIKMGRSAGYHREIAIDKMEFNADGSIKKIVPTHEGVKAVKVTNN
jgi:arabinoxylan arabinofuranohydrolase